MTLILQRPTGSKLTLRQTYIGTDDPDAAAYIAAVEAADGEALETGVQVAIHSFVKGCKNDGIWDAIKASCILAGARTLAGALVPLVGAAPTNYNFVAGDYNRETGLIGDGSTKYLDSNRNNNSDPQDNFHMSCYRTSGTQRNELFMGTDSTAEAGSSVFLQLTTLFVIRCRTLGAQGLSVNPLNFIGISRSASGFYVRRVNASNAIISTPSDGNRSQNINVFAGGGVASGKATCRIAFYSIGESLDLALLDTRVTDLMTAIGVAIP